MTTSPTKNLTIEEYLIYDDGTDNRYELVDGKLIMVPLPTADHSDEIDLLLEVFRAEINQQKLLWQAKRDVGVYIGKSLNTGRDYSRSPDVCILLSEDWAKLKAEKGAAVLRTVPLMVVEVVSTNRKDDYVDKVEEYQGLGIPEYWIVDGRDKLVSVLLLDDGRYHRTEFRGGERIISRAFPLLVLTAEQVLSA
ncbi:Uma2 family endonuclease [Synechocystis sp. PCC 7509]|uniref:Uma2 family endonuclease n=1 Tax=Synechocystis sp. PCC 7509 TaxID=927677 RepID=UPI0002ABBC14|nr:Uma2 family endonuclease [Synechocystis sp. PCC 7509]